jgi:hypothetical protein
MSRQIRANPHAQEAGCAFQAFLGLGAISKSWAICSVKILCGLKSRHPSLAIAMPKVKMLSGAGISPPLSTIKKPSSSLSGKQFPLFAKIDATILAM